MLNFKEGVCVAGNSKVSHKIWQFCDTLSTIIITPETGCKINEAFSNKVLDFKYMV